MDYSPFVKRLVLPAGVSVPRELRYDDVVASALTRDHLEDDVNGINESIELISKTRGGGWPTEPVTEEFNFVDLVWHECEFRDGKSFAYAVYGDGRYIGCCYLYPLGVRTQLTDDLLAYDLDVSWWVTSSAYERGYYEKLYTALRAWLAEHFPFWRPYYSNRESPSD